MYATNPHIAEMGGSITEWARCISHLPLELYSVGVLFGFSGRIWVYAALPQKAYWMVWCIAAPLFIGNISRGRTIKQTILGGYVFGVGSTISSFIILGNYGLGLQAFGAQDFIAQYNESGDLYGLIINIVKSMPAGTFILVLIMICMIAFYATSFDSIAYTAACYSYKKLGEDEKPNVIITLLLCLLLIVLPIALVFSESSMNNIQSVSIISAFPIGIIMILMIWSFFKDAKKYMREKSHLSTKKSTE